MDPAARYDVFASTSVGVDETLGRFGEVTIERCNTCGSVWLRYVIEYEAHARSGRWFRGLVGEEVARAITPERAVAVLESLPWHFHGGSYFETPGARATGSRLQLV